MKLSRKEGSAGVWRRQTQMQNLTQTANKAEFQIVGSAQHAVGPMAGTGITRTQTRET